MRIYNTLTKQKEEFIPLEEKKVRMYACGPTVYNFFHIGNARCFTVFDMFRRYLEYRGYQVTFVQNFTDVDDKIIKRANESSLQRYTPVQPKTSVRSSILSPSLLKEGTHTLPETTSISAHSLSRATVVFPICRLTTLRQAHVLT